MSAAFQVFCTKKSMQTNNGVVQYPTLKLVSCKTNNFAEFYVVFDQYQKEQEEQKHKIVLHQSQLQRVYIYQ